MKFSFTKLLFIIIAVITLSITQQVFAQGVTTAAINGTILDTEGNPLPAATVLAVHIPSGTQYGATTRDDGRYTIPGMRVGGPYTVTVSYVGFTSQQQENVTLTLSQSLELNFVLTSQTIELETVNVVGNKNQVMSSGRTGAATNVTREQIDNLPTIARSFEDFYKLSPLFSGAKGSAGASAAGRNSKYNNIQIDGSNYNDMFGLGGTTPGSQSFVTPISLDAIEEFQIVISPYDVRQGGFTGAGINAITRSGTNLFHGSGFYFGRNENFVGKSPDTLKTKLADFTDYQTGFRVGGPIIENKLFFFVNGEMTRYKQPFTRTFGNQNIGSNAFTVSEDSLNLLSNFLKNTYGYDPGAWNSITDETLSDKFFIRLDYNLSQDHKLTARWNYLGASDDNSPSRGRSLTDIYSDYGRYVVDNSTNTIALQLSSLLSNNLSNELIVGYVRQLDEPLYKGSPFPSLYIRTTANNVQQTLVLGAEQFRHYNLLQQDVIEINDNISYYLKDHTITGGVKLEFFKYRNLFIPGGFGVYTYNSIADFINNVRAASYEYRYSATSNREQEANWSANQFGIYFQDEWNILPNLKVTGGIRFDIPIYPDQPNFNPRIDTTFVQQMGMDIGTNKVPETTVNVSPRLGFNWAVDEDRNIQVRGGIGVFSGRFPAVWVSNQYSNTGVDFYTNTTAPTSFVADPNGQPQGSGVLPRAEVNLTDPKFKSPSILRANLAIDHTLPYNLILSIEGIYSHTQNDVFFRNINLSGLQNTELTPGGKLAGEGRDVWGAYNETSRRFSARLVNGAAFTGVYLLTNTDMGENANFVIQLQRLNATDGLYANVAYTWGISKDVNSGVSAQARSSWRFNPTQGNPNEPVLTYSINDRRHRIMANLSYTLEWNISGFKTNFGLSYNGLSGRPFSYLVNGDVNGDGESDNDLIYIPKDASDIILVASNGTVLSKDDQAYARLFAYIEEDEYLNDNRGTISERNGAREPWIHQIDLHLSQEIPTFGGQFVEITFDILNVMNLINNEWGWQNTTGTNQNVFPLTFHSLETTQSADYGKPRYIYAGGNPSTSNPYVAHPDNSRWQLQAGIRYTF